MAGMHRDWMAVGCLYIFFIFGKKIVKKSYFRSFMAFIIMFGKPNEVQGLEAASSYFLIFSFCKIFYSFFPGFFADFCSITFSTLDFNF